MSLRKVNIDGYGLRFHRQNVAAIMKGDRAEERKAAAAAKRTRRAAKRAKAATKGSG